MGEVNRIAPVAAARSLAQDELACKDCLPAAPVRRAVYERLCDCGMVFQGALKYLRRNHCAVCQHNHVIEAAVHKEETVLVDMTHIARVQPAVPVDA